MDTGVKVLFIVCSLYEVLYIEHTNIFRYRKFVVQIFYDTPLVFASPVGHVLV